MAWGMLIQGRGAGKRRLLLGTTAVGVLLAGGAAWAQDAPEADATELFELGEIVVSARRFEESIKDAPVAVSVTGRDDMGTGKADRLDDIAKTAPNVIGFDGNGVSFAIRGVGSQSIQGVGSEVGVGLFLDEVYLGNPDAAPIFMDDLERAEIVRGSQGTLYGRNTIGGAVNLVTRDPSDTAGGNVEVSTAGDGSYRFRGGFDAPTTDGRWKTRTYLSFTNQADGLTNLPTGEDDLGMKVGSGRFTLTGDLTDRTQMRFTLDAEHVDNDSMGGWAPLPLALNHQSDLDLDADREDKRGGLMLRFDHEFDQTDFSSITAFRGFEQDMILDGDFTSGPYDPSVGLFELQQGRIQKQRQFTQEFRLGSGNFGSLGAGEMAWNAGLFYMQDTLDAYEFYELASVPADMTSRDALDREGWSLAAFGSLEYQLSNQVAVNVGARYTVENQKGDVEISSPSGTYFYGPAQSGSADVRYENFSPEASLSYQTPIGGLIYGRVATGFKSGGISQFFNADGSVNTFDPETSTTYEIGWKTPVLNNSSWLELNVFHTDWKDQQSNVFISDYQRVTANASSATSQGLEMAFQTELSDTWSLGATYGYLDATYDDFAYSYYSSAIGSTQTVDFTGNDIPLSPEHSASLSLKWDKPLSNGLDLTARGTYSFNSGYTFDPVGAYKQPDTHLVDVSFGVRGDNWEANLWVNNLLDEEYLTNYFLFGNVDYGVAGAGRKVGISYSRLW